MRAKLNNPGSLKHRVILQEKNKTQDGLGGFLNSWIVKAYLWARIEPQNQRQVIIGDTLHEETSHEITIRYRKNIKAGMRFLYRDRVLEVLAIRDKQEAGRFLTCQCKEKA